MKYILIQINWVYKILVKLNLVPHHDTGIITASWRRSIVISIFTGACIWCRGPTVCSRISLDRNVLCARVWPHNEMDAPSRAVNVRSTHILHGTRDFYVMPDTRMCHLLNIFARRCPAFVFVCGWHLSRREQPLDDVHFRHRSPAARRLRDES